MSQKSPIFASGPQTAYLFIIMILAYLFFILLENRLLPGILLTGDTALFASIGFGWVEGLIPYRDLFDHKGPAIFFVNALGYALGQWLHIDVLGIVLIELIVGLLWLWLVMYLFRHSPFYGLWAVLTGFIVLMRDAHNGGNFTEEYCLLFAVAAVVMFFEKSPPLRWRFFFYGVCGAATFLFRINNAIVPLLICIFAFLELRSPREWIRALCAALLGFISIITPTLLYFYAHGSLGLMLDGALWYNLLYVDNSNTLQGTLTMIWWFGPTLIMESLLLIWLIYKKTHAIQGTLLFALTLYVGCLLSGRTYNHYMINLLPVHFFLCYAARPTLLPLIKQLGQKLKDLCPWLHHITSPWLCAGLLLVLAMGTGLKAMHSFDQGPIHAEAKLLADAGVTAHSAILNLNKVRGCRVFIAAKALPRQRIFFEPSGQDKNNQKYLFGRTPPEDYTKTYEFIVADADFVHKDFMRVAAFEWGVLYKRL